MGRKPSLFRRIGLLLCASAGAMLVLTIAETVYSKQTQPVQTEPAPSTEQVTASENEYVPLLTDFTMPQFRTTDIDFGVSRLQTDSKEIVNILLVGQDAISESGARSDTMILCTFNKKSDTITLTSFLRDMYVKIPGHKRNRINAAFSYGGIELLNETLYENFGIEVDGNVQVDFSRFEEIIDKLGGVTIELTAAEADFINMHYADGTLTEGTHLLTGEQALLYARDRYDVDGDFSRTNRQRKLLNVLIDTYKSKKLTEMVSLLHEIQPLITTDISKSDLAGYALSLFPMLSSAQIRTQAIPVADGYYYATIDGKSVLMPDMEKNIQALEDSLT